MITIPKLLQLLIARLTQFDQMRADVSALAAGLENQRLLLGKVLAGRLAQSPYPKGIQEAEFQVFSQWGDDGIIQYLVHRLDIPEKRFIEFGVSNYIEANTRFLLLSDNWSGLVLDCSQDNINHIKKDALYWKYDLTALCGFVTAENINVTLSQAGFAGEIGLLHIDVDGNDYWIWKAIEVVEPVIAIIEYNSLFGPDRSLTIPYDAKFDRCTAHHSGIYAGASLPALCDLAQEKGYAFVGSNSAGNNAYFVRKERLGGLTPLTAQQGHVACKFREHRDRDGQLTFLAGQEALKSIRGMKVLNTRTNQVEEL